MANTPVYTRGVKYIKVARIDANGRDNTTQLQNLTDIREVFSDISYPIQFNIIGISEYPTYYLYSIVPTDITSSSDQEILNYNTSGSSTSFVAASMHLPAIRLDSYTIKSGTNTLGYFTASSGLYTLGNTPNITLSWTASITGSNTTFIGVGNFLFNQTDNDGFFLNPVSSYTLTYPTNTTFRGTFSGSFTPVEDQSYAFGLSNNTLGLTGITNFQFSITQSNNTESSTNGIVVLEPYIDENFSLSDCNILQNNVDVNRFDGFFMDMDFTSGSILPQNQHAIINGYAVRAQVQPWNYTYTSQVRGRYGGKQQNAIAVNVYTSASQFITTSSYGFSGSWPGDTTSPLLQGSIVIQQLDSCIYTTNWAGGGYPENSYGGTFSLGDILLVGENKDAVQLFKTDSPLYYQILYQNLPFNSSFIQRAYITNTALSSQLTSLYPGIQLQDAAYWIPSNYQVGGNAIFYPTGSPQFIGQPYIEYSGSFDLIPTGVRNASNTQQTGSGAIAALLFTEMYQDIINGSPWFASMYKTLGNIADGTDLKQYGFPFQISSITSSAAGIWQLFIKNSSNYFPTSSNPYSAYPIGYSGSQSNTGLLLIPGIANQNQLVAYGDIWQDFSSGAGYITLPYLKDIITQNASYITKTYGNNPNP
jgi:hypothetical protein